MHGGGGLARACAGACDRTRRYDWDMTDERYTLEEASRKLAVDECARDGHDYDVVGVTNGFGWHAPLRVVCDRCRDEWRVQSDAMTPPGVATKES